LGCRDWGETPLLWIFEEREVEIKEAWKGISAPPGGFLKHKNPNWEIFLHTNDELQHGKKHEESKANK
jgi:hypothetical protein